MSIPPLEYKTATLPEASDDHTGGMLAYTGMHSDWQSKSPEFGLDNDPEGTAWAIVAVTGVRDDVGDVIVPGAFRRTLRERELKGVLGHDWNRPVAVQRKAIELLPGDPRLPDTLADGVTSWPHEAGALLVKAAYILGTGDGRDAWIQAQAYGASQAYSIGYKVTDGGAKHRQGTRYIHDLDVYEFSPVLHGANRLATLQAIKSGEAELEFGDTGGADTEAKARGVRRVQDAAYWGRPIGTPITPGMKPAGPRARAGARDRGASTRRTESGSNTGQRGVAGGMGAAGLGGIRRDTAAGVRARNARERTQSDRDEQRAAAPDEWNLISYMSGTGERGKPFMTRDGEMNEVPLTSVDTPSLLKAHRELQRREETGTRRDSDAGAERAIRSVLRDRLAETGTDLGDDETPDAARSRQRSVGNHAAARESMRSSLEELRRQQRDESYTTQRANRIRTLEKIQDQDRPLIADRNGRVAAVDQGEDSKGRDLGWAVVDTRTGKILAKGEDDDDVQEYVDGAAEAIETREAREARDGQAGRDGGGALGEASPGRAGEDPGVAARDVLPEPVGGGDGGDRDAGGQPGGPGPAGGAVPREGRPAERGASSGRGAGGPGDDLAGSGDGGADDAGRGGRAPGAGGDERGAGVRDGDRGLLQREGTPDGDAGRGAGTDAVADPDNDAGLPAEGVTADDMPAVDRQAAQQINAVPAGGEAFRPESQDDLAPAGARAKLDANMAAIRTLRALQSETPQRNATADEQAVLARWSGWGSLPKVFDDLDPTYAAERDELRGLLSPDEWTAARKNTLNAHYTDGRVTRAIWDALDSLGFNEAAPDGTRSRKRVLEPGSGSGNFIGMAPESTDMVGVELESTTAAISKYLYPNATIRNEGFEKTKLPDGGFDAVVGNVPYGKYKLHDPSDNPSNKLSVHNHFIMKSLRATRPGGVVAVLTSRYTLDGQDPKAREEMAKLGDLVGAVRLPNGSHQRAAGTDVIEDILIFRRRGDGETPGDQSWVQSSPRDLGAGEDLDVNEYFVQNPTHVLGDLTARSGRFGPEVSVQGDRDMPGLPDALADIVTRARRDGRSFRPRDEDDAPLPALLEPDTSRYEGHVRREADGSFTQARNGGALPLEITSTTTSEKTGKTTTRKLVDPDEMEALLGIRDTLTDLLGEESRQPTETARMRELRGRLNTEYDAYVDRYGPVTRYGYATNGSRQNPQTPRFLATDPQFAIVRALESNFQPGNGGDAKTGTATRASIFTERSAAPRQLATTADTPQDALSLSMDTYGRVDLDAISEMLGTDRAEARRQLGTLVHEVPALEVEEEEALVARARARAASDGVDGGELDDPLADSGLEALREYRGELVPAAEYLSGNVRRKLKIAREAALADPRFERNVAELEAVLPRELGPDEIDGQLGAVWIPADDVAQFAAELLGTDRDNVAVTHLGGKWTIKSKATKSVRATQEWGTKSRNTIELIDAILNKKEIEVSAKNRQTGKSEKDMDATLAAQEKADEIRERFNTWIWENPDRARRLSTEYNDRFNGIALRSYDRQNRQYPGMSAEWKPRPHQVAAVERIISEPTALLGHVVGAGKTAEMAMGAAELKRLGMAKKPAIVVPNHMLEQFTREYLEVYPNAKVLAAGTDDLSGDKRREFIARAATGDWDVVILTQNGFGSIPMSREEMADYVATQTAEMRADLERARTMAREASAEGGTSGRTKRDAADKSIKDMETSIANMTAKLEELLEKGSDDTALTFEATGIDYVFVDEAHQYSNLRTPSSMRGVGADGSGKATDLHMKLEYLRRTTESGRVATFATGTPIRNSVTQAFIMMKYLRPDLLQEAGIHSFDDWANTFGETVTEMELKPEGNGFRQNTRFSKFKNVPELLRIFHTFSDIKLAEDLKLPRPALVGGRAENVVVPGSDTLRDYIRNLGDRAEAVRSGTVDPTDDNMLKISMDGRKAALSMSLVRDPDSGESYDHEPGKIEAAADNIAGIHEQYRDTLYPIDPKRPEQGMHPDPGGLQVVFMDMGTPKSTADRKKAEKNGEVYFDGYEKLREELVSRGMDRSRIRFMHEARNDREKAELFAAARSGKIDVLIGSTEKMGVGTNVQARATALHHLDAPWRPADVEQRDGRVLRQGNGNEAVRILRYVTEDSFDAYMWQTLERKAKFINQIMKGSLDVREIEDVGDTAMSYAEIKALATGNPDLLDKAKVDALHHKLSRLSRNYARQQTNMRTDIGRLEEAIETGTDYLGQFDEALQRRRPTGGDDFAMTVNGQPFTKRADAGDALVQAMRDARPGRFDREGTYGNVGGFTVKLVYYTDGRGYPRYAVRLQGVPGDVYTFDTEELSRQNGAGMVTRIENYVSSLDRRRDNLATQITRNTDDLEVLRSKIGVPFPQEALLNASGAKAARLQAKMERDAKRRDARLSESDVMDLPEDHPLAFKADVDTDEFDDPLVRDTADRPVDQAPADADVAVAEGLTTAPRRDGREVTSPAGEVDDADPDVTVVPALDAITLDAAHSDTLDALGDGNRDAAARALTRMGVPDDESGALADRLMVVPEREQNRLLDSVERLHTADPDGTSVRQQARQLNRDDDTEEITAAELAQGAGDPDVPDGMTPARRAELVQLADDYAGQYGGPASPTPGVDNAARYIMEGHASRDTPIDRAEQTWLRDYIAGRPYLLDQAPPTADQLAERQHRRRDEVRAHLTDAQASATAGDFVEAQRQIDAADIALPGDPRTARARTRLAELRAEQEPAPAGPETGATASSGPAAPPRADELHTGTVTDLGIVDGDQIAIADGSTDADGQPIVMTGEVFGLDGRFIYLRSSYAGGTTIRVGRRDREYQVAKLDGDGRVVPVQDPAAPTQGGRGDAGLPVTTQPTPETTRARTNRVGAAAKLGGGESGFGRRVKDGSVHDVNTADDPEAIQKITDQLDKLGWAGAVVRVGPTFTMSYGPEAGQTRRKIEIQVPDTGPDGRPLRAFTAARPGRTDGATPESPQTATADAPTPDTPAASSVVAREVADKFWSPRGTVRGTVQDAMAYTPDQLRAGADDIDSRAESPAGRRAAQSLRNTADTLERQQRTGRDVEIDPDTGAPLPEDATTISADELADADVPTPAAADTGRAPAAPAAAPTGAVPTPEGSDFPPPQAEAVDLGRQGVRQLVERFRGRGTVLADGQERNRMLGTLTDERIRFLEAALLEATTSGEDERNDGARLVRVLLASTQDEIRSRMDGGAPNSRTVRPTDREIRLADKANTQIVQLTGREGRESRRDSMIAMEALLRGNTIDETAAYFTADERAQLLDNGDLDAAARSAEKKPDNDMLASLARQLRSLESDLQARRGSPEPEPEPTPEQGLPSDDPSRFPDAPQIKLSPTAQNLLRIRITDVLTDNPADDDGLGGYLTPDGGTLRVHDKRAMLATIDNELDITEGNLRPQAGPRPGTPEDRRRWQAEERAMLALRRQVEALPEPDRRREPADAPTLTPGEQSVINADARRLAEPVPSRGDLIDGTDTRSTDPLRDALESEFGERYFDVLATGSSRPEIVSGTLVDRARAADPDDPDGAVRAAADRIDADADAFTRALETSGFVDDDGAAITSYPANMRAVAEEMRDSIAPAVETPPDPNELADTGRRGSFGAPLLATADGRFEVTTGRDGVSVLVTDTRFPRAGGAFGTESYGTVLPNAEQLPTFLAERRAGTDIESLVRPLGDIELRPTRAGENWRSITRIDSRERQTRRGLQREETTTLGFVDADGNVHTAPGPNGSQVSTDELPDYLARVAQGRRGGGDGARDVALADLRAERDAAAPAPEPTPGDADTATISADELAAADLPERGGITALPDDDVDTPQDTPAPAPDVDTAEILRQFRAGGNGETWSALLEPLTADQRRPILDELSFDELDAMAEVAFLSEDRGWRDQLIHAITALNPSVGRGMSRAAFQRDRARARDGGTPLTGRSAVYQTIGNGPDYEFAANMLSASSPAEAARSRNAMTRTVFPDTADTQIGVEADRLDAIADRLDAGPVDVYGPEHDGWPARLRETATAMRADTGAAPAPDVPDEPTAPVPDAPDVDAPTAEPVVLPRLDGPQRDLLARRAPDGATIDGTTLNVDDPDAFDRWLTDEIAVAEQDRARRKDRRALVRLQVSLDEARDGDDDSDSDADTGGRDAGDGTGASPQDRDVTPASSTSDDAGDEPEQGDDGEELALDRDAFTAESDDAGDAGDAGDDGDDGGRPAADDDESTGLGSDADPERDEDNEPTEEMADQADDEGDDEAGAGGGLPPLGDLGVDPAEFDDEDEPDADTPDAPDADAPAADAPAADSAPDEPAPDEPAPDAPPPPDAAEAESATISRDDVADALADANAAEADALGLIEADDGELEVTEEVAQRQNRVSRLLSRSASGELDIARQKDSELSEGRRDVVDELRLQEAITRRENQRRREQRAQRAETTPAPAAAPDVPDSDADTGTDTGAPAPTPEPTNDLAGPTRRPGLAGSVEDLADAIDSGDDGAITAAARRARSSLARSRADSDAHTELGVLIDQLTAGETVDPATLRELAGRLREAARTRRNDKARARRLAKRLERERLRSLLGQYDAELRNRGRNPDDYGGPVPTATPDDGGDGDAPEVAAPPAGMADPGPDGPDPATPGSTPGAGQGTPDTAVPPSFDRSAPDGPTGQARTTELVDGLTAEPWRLLGNADTLFPDTVTAAQRQKMEAAARAAFADLLDTYGPQIRRQNNERIEQARISAMTRRRRMRTGRATDPAAMTFMEALPAATRTTFMEAFREAAADYKRRVAG